MKTKPQRQSSFFKTAFTTHNVRPFDPRDLWPVPKMLKNLSENREVAQG